MREAFIEALKLNQAAFEVDLASSSVERLADYYGLVQENNQLLHLVAPCSAEEFAVRHILESLTLLEFLPANTRFADVGTGAGLPSIPSLLVREDLSGVLIESKEKKVAFLEHAVKDLGISSRTQVINQQFEEVQERDFTHVTCRALDKFTEKLPRLLKWLGNGTFLFFGGPSLSAALEKQRATFEAKLMPLSDQRHLFVGRRSS